MAPGLQQSLQKLLVSVETLTNTPTVNDIPEAQGRGYRGLVGAGL